MSLKTVYRVLSNWGLELTFSTSSEAEAYKRLEKHRNPGHELWIMPRIVPLETVCDTLEALESHKLWDEVN